MFFLKQKYPIGYRYGDDTFYGTKHLGEDILCPTGTKIYAPFDGEITTATFGADGGYTTIFYSPERNLSVRFLHLSKQLAMSGSKVKEGDLIALSGNTGLSTTPHIHYDIFNGRKLPPLVFTNFINPATINWNTMTTHKICVLLSRIENQPAVQSAVDYVKARVEGLTQGQLSISLDYFPTDAQFHTIHGNSTDGNAIVFADPADIGAVGRQAELQLHKQFDLVSLLYDNQAVIGDQPTNPVENPVLLEGFNVNSIPENWFRNQQTGELFPDVIKQYFYHEMLHAWYYIINRERELSLPDKVHNPPPHSGEPGHPTFEDVLQGFDNIVLELKPYWASLGNNDPVITGEPMIIINSTSDQNTKFALAQDQKVGFADFPAFQKYTAGRTVINLTLPDVEFNKIPSSQAVIKS